MVFSKIYYSSFAGSRVKAEQSSFLSVNLKREPGSMLFAGSCAERAAIGGQVASKLALQHFLIGAEESLDFAATEIVDRADSGSSEGSLAAIESGFRTANSAVYDFGHKLSAGGRMAASLISVFITSGLIAAGRVGKGVAYLSRRGEIFPFFSDRSTFQESPSIGSNSIVSVELASVPAEAGDIVIVFSDPIPAEEETEFGFSVSLLLPKFDQLDSAVNASLGSTSPNDASVQEVKRSRVINPFDSISCERLSRQVFAEKIPAFGAILAIGPEVNFLEPAFCIDRAAA